MAGQNAYIDDLGKQRHMYGKYEFRNNRDESINRWARTLKINQSELTLRREELKKKILNPF